MAWYDEAVFYHIYPLGLTGAPKQNNYGEPEHRLNEILPWIEHIRSIGCNAIYIGPLFESVGHGYETTDYKKLDSRLGTNEDLTNFVKECHKQGIRVILDGVFNHTGRDFFAFQDIKKNREGSQYKDWYCNVNFWGNNEYNDGFSYENWGGYNLLVKLNQHNQAVKDYICDVIRFWVSEFDIDGIRLDAADVLDFGYMQALRQVANEVKPDFWLMGEVIHGDYNRWVNEGTLHSVTNYHLHKALYSGHNDHNFFEIAHTVKRLYEMGGNRPDGLKLYNFVDNHDVERIYTKLQNKAHFAPVHILMYTLPGVPSIYYGSEFGIEGRKEKFSDDSLRPQLNLNDYKNAITTNACTGLIAALGKIRQNSKALSYGDYKQLILTNRQYVYSRTCGDETAVIAVNNDDQAASVTVPVSKGGKYVGAISGQKITANNGSLSITIPANSGESWGPEDQTEAQLSGEYKVQPISANNTAKKASESKASEQNDKVNKATETEVKTEQKKNCISETGEKKNVSVQKDNAGKDSPAAAKKEKSDNNASTAEGTKNAANNLTEASKPKTAETNAAADIPVTVPTNKSYEEMTVPELQAAVLEKLAKNGPVTERMHQEVAENVYHDSLVNWVKSFR